MTPLDEYDDTVPATKTISTLSTKGLILVPATIDIPDYSHWLNDPEVVKYSELRHREHTHESCVEYVKTFDQVKNCMWTINLVGASMHIGNITTHHDPHNNVLQMGMLIGEKWAWGRKYGREAWAAVMIWAKDTAKIRRVEAGCMQANMAMRKTMIACGMPHIATVEGHFKSDNLVIHGKTF